METYTIEVENIKCGGCASSIKTKLNKTDGVDSADVDVENGSVTVKADTVAKDKIIASLKSMGYPEVGSVEGLANAKAKATSFVSCAVGKMNKDN